LEGGDGVGLGRSTELRKDYVCKRNFGELLNFKYDYLLLFRIALDCVIDITMNTVLPGRKIQLRKDIDCSGRVHRAATRLVSQLRNLPYKERLERLRLPSLFDRRRRGGIIET